MVDGKRVAGIIAEFNPFHEGHRYIISRAREACSADFVVVVMSGDFVQRGAPAIFSKYDRARDALENGADLVLQLPVLFSTASAEDFAAAGVALLARTGIVDCLAFGSESGEPGRLQAVASLLAEEPEGFREALRAALRAGASYPAAREQALRVCGASLLSAGMDAPELQALSSNGISGLSVSCRKGLVASQEWSSNGISARADVPALQKQASLASGVSPMRAEAGAPATYRDGASVPEKTETEASGALLPNDILGVEYLKAIRRQGIAMEVCAIRREQALGSAHAARARYLAGERAVEARYGRAVQPDDFSEMLSYKLLSLKAAGADLCAYQDVSRELANRIMAEAERPLRFSERIARAKTRQYTYTRVARCLIHVLLEIRRADVEAARAEGYAKALRVLGFRKESRALLGQIRAPLVTSLARAEAKGQPGDVSASAAYRADLFAANVYNAVHGNFQTEYTRKLLVTVL